MPSNANDQVNAYPDISILIQRYKNFDHIGPRSHSAAASIIRAFINIEASYSRLSFIDPVCLLINHNLVHVKAVDLSGMLELTALAVSNSPIKDTAVIVKMIDRLMEPFDDSVISQFKALGGNIPTNQREASIELLVTARALMRDKLNRTLADRAQLCYQYAHFREDSTPSNLEYIENQWLLRLFRINANSSVNIKRTYSLGELKEKLESLNVMDLLKNIDPLIEIQTLLDNSKTAYTASITDELSEYESLMNTVTQLIDNYRK